MKRSHAMPFGTRPLPGGETEFRLWAPSASRVDLCLRGTPSPMQQETGGWHTAQAHAAAGDRYAFRIDGGLTVPDPASRSNPDDVHSPSALVDPLAFDWTDDGWRGRPWHEAAVYELHVGCFTREGTFGAAIEQLDDLVALGVTAIELMPVADFPGRRGWGYDGVLPYAPDASYGTPDDLKRLVCVAHARGLMVLLDVVYNHFGPDGNYLHTYAAPFFNPAVHTPWGAAINFDGEHSRTVRDFFLHNALYWIEEFHIDGLRIDAVHAMRDSSALHFVDELALAVRSGPGRERHVHLVLENDANDARHLAARGPDEAPRADAQWNDDVHHAAHVLATGETDGYYIDYADQPLRLLGRALAQGFAYQGDRSRFRAGERRGTASTHLSPLAFVNALQTHDQVGNRAFGERIATLAAQQHREGLLRALVACLLLSPSPPMIFMGEEFAARSPFLYFCNFTGDLARAVTDGRRAEFARFASFADSARRAQIPDPNDETTFLRSKLDWAEHRRNGHAQWWAHYRYLLGLRRTHLMPWLPQARSGKFSLVEPDGLQLRWPLGDTAWWHLRLCLCLSSTSRLAPLPGQVVYAGLEVAQGESSPAVQVTIEHR